METSIGARVVPLIFTIMPSSIALAHVLLTPLGLLAQSVIRGANIVTVTNSWIA